MQSHDQDIAASMDEQQEQMALSGTFRGPTSPQILPFQNLTAWESMLKMICGLYQGRPDSAVAWWTEPELAQFIRLAADVWTPRFLTQFLHMVAALSCGSNSANHAHHVLSSESTGSLGNVNWSTFFRTLNNYIERLSQTDNSFELSQVESNLITAFLDVVAEVVKYNVTARRVLCENQNFRALDTLFYLLVSRLQIDLKASLFNTIAAFCSPPTEGLDISSHVWNYIEQSQIIQVYNADGLNGVKSTQGLLYDLTEVEVSLKTYPESFAFLNLLKMLIATSPKNSPDSIFDSLGMPNRNGGIRPYISFVIDEVFLNIDERPFANPEERSKITNICLDIFILCLERFDISNAISFLAQQGSVSSSGFSPLKSLGLQPGFEILCRLFSGSRLMQKLISIIENSSSNLKDECSINSLYITLRIIYFGLQIQRSFLEQISPAIVEAKEAIVLQLPSSMTGLDSHLAVRKNAIIQIGAMINLDHDTIALLSVSIISLLSKSSIFAGVDPSEPFNKTNRLVGIFEHSQESNRILKGYSDRLQVEGVEVIGDFEQSSANDHREAMGLYFDPANLKHSIGHNIRLEILDMLLWNISSKLYPNIGHFLLGITSNPGKSTSKVSKISCLPVIVDLLQNDEDGFIKPFFITHPILAEKLYHLIYLICVDSKTSTQSLRFLRNDCDFFARQLSKFSPIEDTPDNSNIEKLVVRQHQLAWLLKCIALELHITSISGQRSQSMKLLNLLFTTTGTQDRVAFTASAQSFEQPLTMASGILHSLNLSENNLPPLDLSQTIFCWVDLAACMKCDERGTEIFDIPTLYAQLLSYVNQLESAGTIMQVGGRSAALEMVAQILDHIQAKNTAQTISSARFHGLQSWCYLIRIAIKGYFDLFSDEVRERRIFELLSTLLQKVGSNGISASVGTCVSQAVLALVSRLDQDRKIRYHYELSQSSDNQMDAFNSAIMQGILDGIQIPGSSSAMRGNYYSALVAFIGFLNPCEIHQGKKANGTIRETASIISRLPNRFWDILCGDASDSELSWQTVAFSTLAALCETVNYDHDKSSSQTHAMINYLVKRNSIGYFIRTITQSDDAILQAILSDNGKLIEVFLISF